MSDQLKSVQTNGKCRICDGTEFRSISPRRSRIPVKARRCGRCGLAEFCPLPTVEMASSGPNTVLTEDVKTKELIEFAGSRVDRVEKLLRARIAFFEALTGRPVRRMLEVGCGTAEYGAAANRIGIDYLGIDLDHRMVEAATRLGRHEVMVGDFLELPESAIGSRDLIFASQVLEHLVDPRAFLQRCAHVLGKDGIVHVDLPNDRSVASVMSRWLPIDGDRYGALEYPHHAMAYGPDALRSLMAGFGESTVMECGSDDDVWGQTLAPSPRLYRIGSLLRRPNLLVGYCRIS